MPRGEGIKPLSDLFEKYKNTLRAPQASVINEFCDVVKDLIEIKIDSDRIKYNPAKKQLILNVPGPIKSELLLHKKEILNHLKGRLGVKSAPTSII